MNRNTHRKYLTACITGLLFLMLGTLLIAAPNLEFRYAYSLALVWPLFISRVNSSKQAWRNTSKNGCPNDQWTYELVIRQMQITVKIHTSEWLTFRSLTILNVGEDMQYREFSFHANDNINWLPPLESSLELSSKVEDKTQDFDKANLLEKI